MPATTTLLGLVTPTQGTLSGTWGDTVNYGISDYVDIAVAGTLTLTNDGAVTLANTTGSSSGSSITSTLTGAGTVTAQFAIVRVTGTLTVAKVVTGPSYSKTYTVVNAATGGIVTFKASGQTGVSVAVGESAFVYFNGTDYVKLVGTATAGAAGGSTTQVQFNSSGVLAGSANMTFDGTSMTLGGNPTLTAGTANGVTYLNGSKVLTSGSALTFNGTSLGVGSSDYGNAGSINLSVGVVGTTTGGVQLWSNTTSAHSIQWGDGTTGSDTYRGAIEYSHNGDSMRFYTSAAEQMRLTSTSLYTASGINVGIGTSSPSSKLEVSGSDSQLISKVTNTNTAGQAASQLITNTAALYSAAFGSTAGGTTWAGLTGNSQTVIEAQNSSSLVIGTFNNSAPIVFAQGRVEVARIDIAGNVGIGTTPTEKFQIYKGVGDTLSYGSNPRLVLTTPTGANGLRVVGDTTPFEATHLTDGSQFSISGQMGANFNAPNATAGSTTKSSPTSAYLSRYWNGTASVSQVQGFIGVTSTAATSTGAYFGLGIGDPSALRIDPAGNLGLGVTPSAWGSGTQALQVGSGSAIWNPGSATQTWVMANSYYDQTDNRFEFISSGTAGAYAIVGNTHQWNISTGTTGANNPTTFSQAMTLDASGNLAIGTTTVNNANTDVLTIGKTSNSQDVALVVRQFGNNTAASFNLIANDNNGAPYNYIASSTQGGTTHWKLGGIGGFTGGLAISTSGSERARIDSAGVFTVNNPAGTQYVQLTPTGSINSVHSNGGGGDSVFGAISGISNGYQISVTTGNAQTYKWHNGGTQSMTLGADGKLLVGTTNATTNLTIGNGGGGNDLGVLVSRGVTSNFYQAYDGTKTFIGGTDSANGYVKVGSLSAHPVAIVQGNGEAIYIDTSKNVLVGKTSPADTVVGSMIRPSGYITSTWAESTDATTTYHVYSTGASAYRFYVGLGGTVFATSIVITAISDQRLKENVRDIDTGLNSIMALKPRRFDWKEGKGQDKKNVAGFIAQEFETVFPECVSTSKAGEDGIEYKNINHETLIPTLVKAIQELKAEFDAYKASHP